VNHNLLTNAFTTAEVYLFKPPQIQKEKMCVYNAEKYYFNASYIKSSANNGT
jgi:hypothetical protein